MFVYWDTSNMMQDCWPKQVSSELDKALRDKYGSVGICLVLFVCSCLSVCCGLYRAFAVRQLPLLV